MAHSLTQDLISKILILDPRKRLSLDAVLRHDWVWGSAAPHERQLSPNLKHIRKHMARKKLKTILTLGRVTAAFAKNSSFKSTNNMMSIEEEPVQP